MSIEQHFVALARVGYQPECTAGTQLEVRHLHASIDAANHQTLFAPVELKRFAQCKLQRHEGVRCAALAPAPAADESGELAVTAAVTVRLNLRKQSLCRAPLLLGAVCIGVQRLFHRLIKRAQFKQPLAPAVLRRCLAFRTSEPAAYRIAR